MIIRHVYVLLFVFVLLGLVYGTGCQSGKEKTSHSDKNKTISVVSKSDKSPQQDSGHESEASGRNRISARTRNGGNNTSASSASVASTPTGTTPKRNNVSNSSSASQASNGTQIGNMIVEKARQESGTVDPNSRESQMADQLSQAVSSPKKQANRTTGQELEDIGEQCFSESLRRAFNNL